ncbi:hypothetical protein [uncultured Nostoc sp.]|uniref:hypothetical protein n=1 Tax=uncultured Nostoc sp. TaxID=340711 RepID=UPI0035CB09B3
MLSSRPIPTNKNNPCPICENLTGACRIFADDTVFCHGLADTRKGEKANGYVCVKPSNGHTATFKLDNSEEWTEERRREWEQRKAYLYQQSQEQEQQRREKTLNSSDRHKLYSEILASQPQDERLIAELQQRGFTAEEIANCGFKSVSRYQELPREFDKRLPGVTEDGKRLIVSGDGYLCPIRDFEGRIVALQLRLYNPGEDEGRYRSVSSSENPHQILPLVVGDALENPLAVFHPAKPEAIALVEGTGTKPFLASTRLNLLTIGASGGLFASSPNLLKNYLDRALDKVGREKTLVIFPDAGDVRNRQVVNRWKRLAELLTNFEWDFKFGWWGQLTKNDSDVDELDSSEYSKIQYISTKEFFAIADKQLKLLDQQKQTADKAKQQSNEIQQLASIRQRLTHITEIPYRVVNVPHMGEVLKDLIEPGTVNIIISETGTGKTESVKPFADNSEAFYSWHNRRSLGRKTSSDLGLNYKDDISGNGQKKKATFCSPSAYQFEPKNLSNKGVLLFDECDQVFDFNFGSLCNKDGIRPLILATLEAHFQSAIAGNGIVLCMSADTTQKEIDYIKAVTPEGTPVRLIINKYQPKRPDINLDTSPSPEGLLDLLVEKLKAGVNCFVLDDMKDGVKGCKSIAEYVRQELKDIPDLTLEIHSDSMDNPNVQEFVQSADKKSEQYRFVVTSPSIISGISLKNQRFVNGVFAFCNGILGDREIKQFLNRVRGAEDIYMWIAEEGYPPRGVNPDLVTPQEIHDYYQRNYAANSKHILSLKTDYDPMTSEWTSPHFELFVKNLSYKMMTMKHLRHFTVEHLREIGYGIIEQKFVPSKGVKKIKEKLADIWGSIDLKEAEAIAAARILSDSEMEAIQHSGEDIPPELKPAYLKTRMLQIFGQELIDATTFEHKSGAELSGFAAMALKNKGGRYGRHLENFYLLNQDIGEAIARDYAAEARQLKVSGERFAGDIRWNASKRKAWEFVGLPEFLNPDKWWQPRDYEQMGNIAKKYHHRVRDTLGLNVEKITNGQIFGEFMHQIALELETKQVDGQKWKYRRITPDSWKFAQMYLTHKQAMKAVKEPLPEVAAVPEINSIVSMLLDYLPQAKTREQCEDLFGTASEQQKSEAWAMLAQTEQQRISVLFEIQAIQPTIFEEVSPVEPVEPVEPLAIRDIEQKHQEPAVTEKSPIQNQQSRIEKLVKISNWAELGMTQTEIDEIWPLLSEGQRSHLWEISQRHNQQVSLEQLAQQAIAKQIEVKETGFGLDHFRSYVLKAFREGMAIACKCWGDKQECQIPLSQLVFSG